MLIDKGVSSGDVVTIKLTSGEELVSSLVEETDAHYKVSKPRVLTATKEGIGMVPYLFTVDPDRNIKIHKPVVVCEPSDEQTAKQYSSMTSGIALV